VACGLVVWGLVAVAGLAGVLAASADAYAAVRLAGAAYLVWLGARLLRRSWRGGPGAPVRHRGSVDLGGAGAGDLPAGGSGALPRSASGMRPAGVAEDPAAVGPGRRSGGDWRTGLVTNLLNPKIGVFYTSVLPQLVPRGAPTAATEAGLVLAHAGLSLAWLNGWAVVLGRSRTGLRRATVSRALERISGGVLVAFGVEIAARTV
jgi:threonine/homoserine/homoserine lactone efflux protein